jgi:uncharacterized DUF497 family protein
MAYTLLMEFEWDDAKSEACFLERGFDFEFAAQAFFDPKRRTMPDTRRAYGEDRSLMATSNSPTCGQSNSPGQDGRIMSLRAR